MSKNIYLISATLDDKIMYKIGYTKRDVNKRIKEMKTGNPYSFNIEKVYVAKDHGISIEKSLHRTFKTKRIDGEWFNLDENDVDNFILLCEKYYDIFKNVSSENSWVNERGYIFK